MYSIFTCFVLYSTYILPLVCLAIIYLNYLYFSSIILIFCLYSTYLYSTCILPVFCRPTPLIPWQGYRLALWIGGACHNFCSLMLFISYLLLRHPSLPDFSGLTAKIRYQDYNSDLPSTSGPVIHRYGVCCGRLAAEKPQGGLFSGSPSAGVLPLECGSTATLRSVRQACGNIFDTWQHV